MTAPTIRTIKALDIKRGKNIRMEQDKTEILDYTVDFTDVFGSGVSSVQSATLTLPAGLTQAGSTTLSGMTVTYSVNASGATYDQDYTIGVLAFENSGSATATKVQISHTIAVRDL